LGKWHPSELHHQRGGVAVRAATEASPPGLAGVETETRVLVLMERAWPPEAAATLPAAAGGRAKQGGHDSGQVDPILDLIPVDRIARGGRSQWTCDHASNPLGRSARTSPPYRPGGFGGTIRQNSKTLQDH